MKDNALKIGAILKRIRGDSRHRGRKLDMDESGAPIERLLSDTPHGIGNLNPANSRTPHERIITDFNRIVRNDIDLPILIPGRRTTEQNILSFMFI